MTFDHWYVLSIVIVLSLILGVDLAKPRGHMCHACQCLDERATNIRTWIVTPFLVIGLSRVMIGVVFQISQSTSQEWATFAMIFIVAGCIVAFLIESGRRVGTVFKDNIWVLD